MLAVSTLVNLARPYNNIDYCETTKRPFPMRAVCREVVVKHTINHISQYMQKAVDVTSRRYTCKITGRVIKSSPFVACDSEIHIVSEIHIAIHRQTWTNIPYTTLTHDSVLIALQLLSVWLLYTVTYCLPVPAWWMSPEPGHRLAYIVGSTEQIMTTINNPVFVECVDSDQKYHFLLIMRGALLYVGVSWEENDYACINSCHGCKWIATKTQWHH